MNYAAKMTHRTSRGFRIFAKAHHDKCTECNRPFDQGDTYHLGYAENDRFVNACDACSSVLVETSTRHVFTYRPYTVPDPSTKLWRYFDFPKYVSLLHKQALYFSSAALFSDPFEGAKGLLVNKPKWDEYYMSFFRDAVVSGAKLNGKVPTAEEVEKNARRLLGSIDTSGELSRKTSYINCWHENEYESDAMWRLYSRDNYSAVAIQTTYQRLYDAIDRDPDVTIGRVNYIDYTDRLIDINNAYWYKRNSFAHEREVRAVIAKWEEKGAGMSVPVDLSLLIEKIYVSPLAQSWLIELVEDINSKYGIAVSVHQSLLNQAPFY